CRAFTYTGPDRPRCWARRSLRRSAAGRPRACTARVAPRGSGRSAAAYRAGGRFPQSHLGPAHTQCIEHLQPAAGGLAEAARDLERLGCLHRPDDAGQRREHAHRRAGDGVDCLVGGEHAVIAGAVGIAQVEHRDLPVEADRRAAHQRGAVPYAGAIDRVTGGEVVGAVEDDLAAPGPGIELLVVEPGVQRDDLDAVVDAVHGDLGRARLGPADPLDAVGDLALQVGRVDVVAVRDDDAADARGGQVERGRRAQPAGAHDQDGGIEQALLRLDADLVEQDVPAVAQELLVVHPARPRRRAYSAVVAAALCSDCSPGPFATMTGRPFRWFSACLSW